uniref:Mediator complex subunit 22 n=1 Tax=Ovis aries TaxID=9940 RepID=A0AC11AVD8_SHEEP
MAQQRALPQSKETLLQSYNKRLKDDVKSIMDNFTEIIKTAKIEDETQVSRATQGEQDNYEMHVRAGESLMKLVSDLKQFLILNDFPSVNEAIDQRNQQLRALQEESDRKLIALRDEVSIDLYELEEEYYSSRGRSASTVRRQWQPATRHLRYSEFITRHRGATRSAGTPPRVFFIFFTFLASPGLGTCLARKSFPGDRGLASFPLGAELQTGLNYYRSIPVTP